MHMHTLYKNSCAADARCTTTSRTCSTFAPHIIVVAPAVLPAGPGAPLAYAQIAAVPSPAPTAGE